MSSQVIAATHPRLPGLAGSRGSRSSGYKSGISIAKLGLFVAAGEEKRGAVIGWEATSPNLDAGHFHPSSPKGHALLMRRRGVVVVVEHTSAFTTTSHRDILTFSTHTPPPHSPPLQAAVSRHHVRFVRTARPEHHRRLSSFIPAYYLHASGLGSNHHNLIDRELICRLCNLDRRESFMWL